MQSSVRYILRKVRMHYLKVLESTGKITPFYYPAQTHLRSHQPCKPRPFGPRLALAFCYTGPSRPGSCWKTAFTCKQLSCGGLGFVIEAGSRAAAAASPLQPLWAWLEGSAHTELPEKLPLLTLLSWCGVQHRWEYCTYKPNTK